MMGANVVPEMNANNEIVWAWVNAPGLDQPVERIVLGRFCSMEKGK